MISKDAKTCWLTLAIAGALLSAERIAVANAFDGALDEEHDDQAIEAVLGEMGVRALNQAETRGLKGRLKGKLTRFREPPRRDPEHDTLLVTAGYYTPRADEGARHVEINLDYFDRLKEHYGGNDAMIMMKLTLVHEGQHAIDHTNGTLSRDKVRNEKSARRAECLVYYKVRRELRNARLRHRLDKKCKRITDEDGNIAGTAGEDIKQLCYKSRSVRQEERGTNTVGVLRYGVRFSYDANWQLRPLPPGTTPGFGAELTGPELPEPVSERTARIVVVVEPVASRGGRFSEPAELAAALRDMVFFEQVAESSELPPVSGFEFGVQYRFDGVRTLPPPDNDYELDYLSKLREQAIATPFAQSRYLVARRFENQLWAVYADINPDAGDGAQSDIAAWRELAGSLAAAPTSNVEGLSIESSKLGLAWRIGAGWTVDPPEEIDGGWQVRAGGPVGPGFTQPSITVERAGLPGDAISLDELAAWYTADIWGEKLYVRPAQLSGFDEARELARKSHRRNRNRPLSGA
ncbi:MAG: hypothetical protein MJA32_12675 [Proteobacteria bacterium]|nr:hypothetical protein [Pseudomonadota bacterium]